MIAEAVLHGVQVSSDDPKFPIRGANPFAGANVIMMYGAAPFDQTPRWPAPHEPPFTLPQTTPLQPYIGTPSPAEPDTAEAMVTRIKHRIAWLENELRMHDAWRTELDTLKKMLAVVEPSEQMPSDSQEKTK